MLQHRSVVAVFALIMIIGCGLLAMTTTSELAPDEDQSFLFIATSSPEYANIDYLMKYDNSLNKIFTSIPEVQDYFIVNNAGTVNSGMAGAILKPWDARKRKQSKIQEELQNKVSKIAGVNTFAVPLPSIPGSSDGLPIQFVVTSTSDHKMIYEVLHRLQDAATASGLFMYLDSDLKFELPELEIAVDREKAALMGVNMQDVGVTLATLLGGNYINRFSREGNSYQVIPQVPRLYRLNPDSLKNINIPAGDSHKLIPLSTILKFSVVTKPNQLNQFQQLNSATLQGMMMPGKTITQGLDFLTAEAKKTFPQGMTYDFAGESRQISQEGSSMVNTFFFSLIIIYLVLAAQFESFRDPLIILISVPMSIAGALIPLNIGFATLNIYTGIGLVTLIGLISKHGILMVDFANKLQLNEGLDITAAIIKSASIRLRPILMTTAAMVLGVAPLIMASGAGAASRFNIGLVIASGMIIGTTFTLFVVPTMYTFFAKRHAVYQAVKPKLEEIVF